MVVGQTQLILSPLPTPPPCNRFPRPPHQSNNTAPLYHQHHQYSAYSTHCVRPSYPTLTGAPSESQEKRWSHRPSPHRTFGAPVPLPPGSSNGCRVRYGDWDGPAIQNPAPGLCYRPRRFQSRCVRAAARRERRRQPKYVNGRVGKAHGLKNQHNRHCYTTGHTLQQHLAKMSPPLRAKYAAYCQASGSSKQITKTRPIEPQPTCANLCHLATAETYFKRLSHQHITEQKVFAVLLETGNGQNHESHPFSCPAARADAASHANRSSPKLPAKPLPPALPSRLPGVAVEAVWFVPRPHGIDWASRSMRSWGATKEKGKTRLVRQSKICPRAVILGPAFVVRGRVDSGSVRDGKKGLAAAPLEVSWD